MTTTPNATGTADTADILTGVGAVDADHVAEVCRLAAVTMPYATRYSARAVGQRVDGSGVTVVAVSPRIRRTVAHALRRHGYQLAHVPPETLPEILPEDPVTAPMGPAAGRTTGRMAGLAVRVTGWSPSGLARRAGVLTRAVADLERSLPATIAQAVRAYALLHDDLDPTIALYGTADAVRAGLQAQITRQAGPLPRRRPSTRGLPEPVRQHLAAVNDLTRRVTDLLALHWTAAVRAAVRYSELAHRHPPAAAQANAITETYTTIRRQHRTAPFLDACTWADTHLAGGTADTAEVAAFARWYIAEFAPPHGSHVPFETAARRWHTHSHPPGRHHPADAHPELPASVTDTPSGGTS